MNSSYKIALSIVAAGALIAGAFLAISSYSGESGPPVSSTPQSSSSVEPSPSDTSSPSVSPTPVPPSISHIRITPPEGWYAHTLQNHLVIYTKQAQFPSIPPNTEGFAIGEHISVAAMIREEAIEEWEAMYAPDDVMTLSKSWSTLNGHKLMKVEQEAGGAAGKMLNYYLLIDNKGYHFDLYPLEEYNARTKTSERNADGVAALEQIFDRYVPHLK